VRPMAYKEVSAGSMAEVADWRLAEVATHNRKKDRRSTPTITVLENPDILATLAAAGRRRPRLLFGFATETEDLAGHASSKLARKGCDWIVANDVPPGSGASGGGRTAALLVTAEGVEHWPTLGEGAVACRLVGRIAGHLGGEA